MSEELNDHAKGYEAGQQDLYGWIEGVAQEWYDLKIVDDKQWIALMMLIHEIDKLVYYKYKGEE